jgi:hypothetical protein
MDLAIPQWFRREPPLNNRIVVAGLVVRVLAVRYPGNLSEVLPLTPYPRD